jgi:hypothetical protein
LLQTNSKESEHSMSNNTKVWLHSLVAAAIGGAASALGAVLISPSSFNFTLAGWENIGKIAFAGAVIPVLALLKKSPLPDTGPDIVDGANSLKLNP